MAYPHEVQHEVQRGDTVRVEFRSPRSDQQPTVYEGEVVRIARNGEWVDVRIPRPNGVWSDHITRRFRMSRVDVVRKAGKTGGE